MKGDGLVAFRYCDARGGENLIDALVGGTDGCGLFESLAGFARVD
jgi:hypothetical protein